MPWFKSVHVCRLALVFPSLLLKGSSSTNMNGFCVTSLKVKGVKVFKKLTTRLCLGLRVCMSVDWLLCFLLYCSRDQVLLT